MKTEKKPGKKEKKENKIEENKIGIDKETIKEYFEIKKIEEKSATEIINMMWEKIENYINILENIINPEGDPILLFEIENLTKNEKEEAWNTLKKLMKLKREKEIGEIKNNEKEKTEIINKILKVWKEELEKIKRILKKMKNSWDKNLENKNKMNYLG